MTRGRPRENSGGRRPNSGGPRRNSGGARPNAGGRRPNTGGAQPNSGGPRVNSGGKRKNSGGRRHNSGGPRLGSGGKRPHTGGSRANTGGKRRRTGGARINSGGPRSNSGGARLNSGGKRPGAGRPRKSYLIPEPDSQCSREDHEQVSEAPIVGPEDIIITITDINEGTENTATATDVPSDPIRTNSSGMQQSAFIPEEDVSEIQPNPQPSTLNHSARMNIESDPPENMALHETAEGSHHTNVPRSEFEGMANACRTTETDEAQDQNASTLDFTIMEDAAESEEGTFSVYYD